LYKRAIEESPPPTIFLPSLTGKHLALACEPSFWMHGIDSRALEAAARVGNWEARHVPRLYQLFTTLHFEFFLRNALKVFANSSKLHYIPIFQK
jgi:hypothetical protein